MFFSARVIFHDQTHNEIPGVCVCVLRSDVAQFQCTPRTFKCLAFLMLVSVTRRVKPTKVALCSVAQSRSLTSWFSSLDSVLDDVPKG